ncbi:RNA-binding domain-containing protein [Clostridium sp. YIM B02506]|uniref:RNA-binding domain-containing protein n=1 Tax=Clostridium sp. YIM B02506 TaxID=2910680 RepID=UPI001EED1975|nr:RNA-binding domain-containing protein [Clostridium sp. YIM B02506]
MPLPINIQQLFDGTTVEWERIEFKAGWNPNEVMHTISAFANDINNWGGGYIIIGVEDINGRPVLPPKGIDIENIDDIQKKLLNFCNLLKPTYFPIVEPILYMGKHLLIIWAPGGQNRPYKCPKDVFAKQKDYKFYLRRFANTIPAKDEDEKELYNLAGKIPFDDRISLKSEVSDLKISLIKEYLRDVGSELHNRVNDIPTENIGKQMNIIDGSNEFLKPKNIGILMFNEYPQKFIPMSQIELVHFEETSADNVFVEKVFTGPIHEQIKSILKYIENSVIEEKVIKIPDKAEAIRVFNYPYAAIEEAIVNAVYHRSYEERNPIEVRIDKEKIIILSYPGPDKSIRKSDIDSGQVIARRYRNRRIGEFLKELKLTEGRSTGIPKILRSMKINNSPKPKFDTDDERTYFLVELPINQYFDNKNTYEYKINTEFNGELNNDQLRVLEYIKLYGEISTAICKRELKFGKTKSLELFNQLIDLGKIKRTGKGPKTKYILVSD